MYVMTGSISMAMTPCSFYGNNTVTYTSENSARDAAGVNRLRRPIT